MQIVVDTREQAPLDFASVGIPTQRAKCYPGDYTIAGLEQKYAVERKGVASGGGSDLVGTIVQLMRGERGRGAADGGSLRFMRELAAMSAIIRAGGVAYVAVTRPRAWFASHQYRSELSPAALFGKVASLVARFGVPFVFFASDYELRDHMAIEARHVWRRYGLAPLAQWDEGGNA